MQSRMASKKYGTLVALRLFIVLQIINVGLIFAEDSQQHGDRFNCPVTVDNNETIANCNYRSLFFVPTGIPKTVTVLHMRANFISSIPPGAFIKLKHLKEIDLSGNRVFLTFHQDSLMGLQSLMHLSLTKTNGVSFDCNNGSSRLFRHTPQLQNLRMKRTEKFDTKCINSTFQDLPNLRYLSITWPYSPLPHGFSLLKQLDILDMSKSTFNLSENNFQALSLLNVSRLALREIRITGFSKRTLNPVLQNLRVLDFSCNDNFDEIGLKSRYFSPIVECLENSTRLESLILDRCYDYDAAIAISSDQFYPLKRVPLKALSLRQNAVTTVAPFLKHLKHLEYFNGDYNIPIIFKDTKKLLLDIGFKKHLKEFYLSHQFLYSRVINVCDEDESEIFMREFSDRADLESKRETLRNDSKIPGKSSFKLDITTESSEYTKSGILETEYRLEEYLNDSKVRVVVSLEKLNLAKIGVPMSPLTDRGQVIHELNISDFSSHGMHVQLTNNLKFVNISSNFMSSIDFVVYGLDSLKIVDISDNNLQYVHSKLFRALGKLEHLFASRNMFGLFKRPDDLVTTLSGLPNIKTIDLSINRLNYLPRGIFSECPNLIYLDLQRNGMKSVHLKFSSLPSLKYLDLSHNEIKGFSKEQTEDLLNCNFSLRLENNSGFECSCDNIPFIEGIQSDRSNDTVLNKSNLICEFADGRMTALVDVDLNKLYIDCIKEVIIIAVATMAVVLLSTSLIMWRYQWYIKYWIYVLRLRHRHDYPADGTEPFASYISYADNDYDLANTVCTKLEESNLPVFFRDRDTNLGKSIFDEYFRGIESSRKCILCLTDSHLNCAERYFELQMSMVRGKGFLIPVVVGNLALEKLPKPLRRLLRDDVYFEWPKTDLEEEDFWKSLIAAVLTRKGVCIRKNGAVMYYAD